MGGVTIVAPFIKVDALQSLLDAIDPTVPLRCVTRWLPREVAAGVSDPEILDVLERRGGFTLCLVDHLHAKLYIAGDRCLAGSSNVTLAGLGEGIDQNIEILVETTTDDPAVIATLDEISEVERPATRAMARAARFLADCLTTATNPPSDSDTPWFPTGRRPKQAYRVYTQPADGHLGTVDRMLLADLARANLPAGLGRDEFRATIRALLGAIPIAEHLLKSTEDVTIARADVNSYLETLAGTDFSTRDLWIAFVDWMAYFFPRPCHEAGGGGDRPPARAGTRSSVDPVVPGIVFRIDPIRGGWTPHPVSPFVTT